MTFWENKGYNSWFRYKRNNKNNALPLISQCPARYMRPGSLERKEFIRGWDIAEKEYLNSLKEQKK